MALPQVKRSEISTLFNLNKGPGLYRHNFKSNFPQKILVSLYGHYMDQNKLKRVPVFGVMAMGQGQGVPHLGKADNSDALYGPRHYAKD